MAATGRGPSSERSNGADADGRANGSGAATMTTSTTSTSNAVHLLRGLALFLLLRFFLVHSTVLYLAYTRPAMSSAPTSAPASAFDPNVTIRGIPKPKQQQPKQPVKPEPIIKTITKKVTVERQMTELTPVQIQHLEKELGRYRVPSLSEAERLEMQSRAEAAAAAAAAAADAVSAEDVEEEDVADGAGGDETLDDNVEEQLQANLDQLSNLQSKLSTLLAAAESARGQHTSDVDELKSELRKRDRVKTIAEGSHTQKERVAVYQKKLAEVARLLKRHEKEEEIKEDVNEDINEKVDGSRPDKRAGYQSYNDEQLQTLFDNALGQLEELLLQAEDDVGKATIGNSLDLANPATILTDLGGAFQAALGEDGVGNGNHGKTPSSVKVCDPAFLSRPVPPSCRAFDGNDAVDAVPATSSSSCAGSIPQAPGDIARESDLFAYVGSIEERLRDRTGRFSGIRSGSADVPVGLVGPLTDPDARQRLNRAMVAAVAESEARVRQEEETAAEARAAMLSDNNEEMKASRYAENDDEDDDDEKKICVTEKDVEYLMDEGLDALQRKKDLREELVSALRLLYDERGEQFDSQAVDREFVRAWEEQRQRGPRSVPHPDWTRAADASYAHRGTVRTLLDTPTFHEAVGKLDALADAIGGYNEGIDTLIDLVAGDERDGGSVSKTIKAALLNVAGRIPIPPQYYKWKERAGVLAK